MKLVYVIMCDRFFCLTNMKRWLWWQLLFPDLLLLKPIFRRHDFLVLIVLSELLSLFLCWNVLYEWRALFLYFFYSSVIGCVWLLLSLKLDLYCMNEMWFILDWVFSVSLSSDLFVFPNFVTLKFTALSILFNAFKFCLISWF